MAHMISSQHKTCVNPFRVLPEAYHPVYIADAASQAYEVCCLDIASSYRWDEE